MPQLAPELSKIDADIIHTHLPSIYTSDISWLVARQKKLPCVINYHNDLVFPGKLGHVARLYNRTGLRLLLRNVDKK
jgi:hypothetical protein